MPSGGSREPASASVVHTRQGAIVGRGDSMASFHWLKTTPHRYTPMRTQYYYGSGRKEGATRFQETSVMLQLRVRFLHCGGRHHYITFIVIPYRLHGTSPCHSVQRCNSFPAALPFPSSFSEGSYSVALQGWTFTSATYAPPAGRLWWCVRSF